MNNYRAWHDESKQYVYFDYKKMAEDQFQSQIFMDLASQDRLEMSTDLHDENKRDLYIGDFVELAIDVFGFGSFVTKTYKAEIRKDKLGFYFYINEDLQYYFNECIRDEEGQLKYIGNIHEGGK